mgnify:CR=1 FL=1
MKKFLITLSLTALILISSVSLYAQGSGKPSSNYYIKVPPVTVKALLAAPAATGKSAFELAAGEFNKWLDRKMSDLPKNERPYADALTIARMCDSMIKSYRSGNTALAEEIAWRIPVDMTVEEKISFLETITQAYLAAEAKKK